MKLDFKENIDSYKQYLSLGKDLWDEEFQTEQVKLCVNTLAIATGGNGMKAVLTLSISLVQALTLLTEVTIKLEKAEKELKSVGGFCE